MLSEGLVSSFIGFHRPLLDGLPCCSGRTFFMLRGIWLLRPLNVAVLGGTQAGLIAGPLPPRIAARVESLNVTSGAAAPPPAQPSQPRSGMQVLQPSASSHRHPPGRQATPSQLPRAPQQPQQAANGNESAQRQAAGGRDSTATSLTENQQARYPDPHLTIQSRHIGGGRFRLVAARDRRRCIGLALVMSPSSLVARSRCP